MTAFIPATALKAIALLEAAGVPDARRLLADYTAAGLVRSYALVIETAEIEGPKTVVRGAAVPVELWQRIVREKAAPEVWTGGTVRLEGSELIGGAPAVAATGTGFHKGDLDRLVEHHGGRVVTPCRAGPTPQHATEEPGEPTTDAAKPRRKVPVPPIAPGAMYASVAQAMDTLRFGRTKINEMMNDGRLVKHKIDGATRIEVVSILAMAGVRA